MNNTFEIILDALVKAGYTENDALSILARYLEEEAELFIECMKTVKYDHDRKLLH